MAVKVLILAIAITVFGAVLGDDSLLNFTSSEANEIDDGDQTKIMSEQADQLRVQPAIQEAENEVNFYQGSGYVYQQPNIPFETGNLDYDGYEYPRPMNPMMYPPPQPSLPTSPEHLFPEATARF